MNAQNHTFYHLRSAELRSDGMLRIRISGSDDNRLFDGMHEVPPDSPDYNFWLWLTKRFKRPRFSFRPVNGLSEPEIAKYREEYHKERG